MHVGVRAHFLKKLKNFVTAADTADMIYEFFYEI
jgi:hypothetical protein